MHTLPATTRPSPCWPTRPVETERVETPDAATTPRPSTSLDGTPPCPAYAGDVSTIELTSVNATVFTDCNLLNQTMVVHYAISNSSTYLTSGNWSWTAMNLNDTHYVEVTNIPAGTYTLTADVYYGSSYAYLASYNTTIIVFTTRTPTRPVETERVETPCDAATNLLMQASMPIR